MLARPFARSCARLSFRYCRPDSATPERWWRRAMRVLFSAPVNVRPRISRGQGSAGGRLTLPPCARASGAGGGRMCLRYRRAALGQAAVCHVQSLFAAAVVVSPRCSGVPRTHERTLIAALPLPPVNEEPTACAQQSSGGTGSSVHAAARPRVYFRFVGEWRCG